MQWDVSKTAALPKSSAVLRLEHSQQASELVRELSGVQFPA